MNKKKFDCWIFLPAINATVFSKCQIDGEDFAIFCGLLRKHELYACLFNTYVFIDFDYTHGSNHEF